MARDEFTEGTKRIIAGQAGYRCANPCCDLPTIGARQGDTAQVLNLGEAAHITAASEDGERYDPNLTREERRSHSNGIWLCRKCARAVDADAKAYSVAKLREWKEGARARSFRAVMYSVPAALASPPLQADLAAIRARLVAAAESDIQGFMRGARWPRHAVNLPLRLFDGQERQPFDAATLGAATGTFNELVIVAPPGTGKTTSLVQITSAILAARGVPAFFVPLNEWAVSGRTLFDELMARRALSSFDLDDLRRLAEAGELSLALDGWNELDATSKNRAATAIKSLQRDYPSMTLVVSTRRQALGVPVGGQLVEIDLLTNEQQKEIATALRGDVGRTLIDQAWRTLGVRELVGIPLYLSALLSQVAGAKLPTTKEELLALFVAEHERSAENRTALHDSLMDRQSDFLVALASIATKAAATVIADRVARPAIAQTSATLAAAGQATSFPQPAAILDTLIAHHCLMKSGPTGDDVSFQHQQIQEWYASFAAEAAIVAAHELGGDAATRLKIEFLDVQDWEEPILFAVERLSRASEEGAAAVASAIRSTLEVDPMLAAEMIFRSSDAAWALVKSEVQSFGQQWHEAGKVDRAVSFMVRTGKAEFADQVWPVVADPDQQVHLRALRSAPQFRPAVLGDVGPRIAGLSPELRAHILSEIASRSGYDGVVLATDLAIRDGDVEVQSEVVQSLAFRRADDFVTKLLKSAPDATWRKLAAAHFPEELEDPDQNARLAAERSATNDQDQSALSRLFRLTRLQGGDAAGRANLIAAIIEADDFPIRHENVHTALRDAFQVTKDGVQQALIHRLERGAEIPFRAERYLRTLGQPIEEGPLADVVLAQTASQNVLQAAAVAVGPVPIGVLINRLLAAPPARWREEGRPRLDQSVLDASTLMKDTILSSSGDVFLRALLDRPEDTVANTISVLSDLIIRFGRPDEGERIEAADNALIPALRRLLVRWGETLLSNEHARRYHLSELVGAITKVGDPSFATLVSRILDRDLAEWRAARTRAANAPRGRQPEQDSYTSYTNRYQRAFGAIGGDAVSADMIARLADPDFGYEAAAVLFDLWKQEAGIPLNQFSGLPTFRDVRERRQDEAFKRSQHRYAGAILNVARRLGTAPAATELERRLATSIAGVAYLMPGPVEWPLVDALLDGPGNRMAKQRLLIALAMRGEIVSAGRALAGLRELVEDAKSKSWLLDQNRSEAEDWLILMALSDRPLATIEGLELLPAQRQSPWALPRLLSTLGYAPSDDAEVVLQKLAESEPRFRNTYEWFAAFEKRRSLTGARTLLNLIAGESSDAHRNFTGARHFAAELEAHPEFRAELYARYRSTQPGRAKSLLENIIVQACDEAGLFALIDDFAATGRAFNHSLSEAVRNLATVHEPSPDWPGAHEIVSVPLVSLRKTLFAMTELDEPRALLAEQCLTAIDQLHDEYGSPEGERRHPAIESGRPWPMVPKRSSEVAPGASR